MIKTLEAKQINRQIILLIVIAFFALAAKCQTGINFGPKTRNVISYDSRAVLFNGGWQLLINAAPELNNLRML